MISTKIGLIQDLQVLRLDERDFIYLFLLQDKATKFSHHVKWQISSISVICSHFLFTYFVSTTFGIELAQCKKSYNYFAKELGYAKDLCSISQKPECSKSYQVLIV